MHDLEFKKFVVELGIPYKPLKDQGFVLYELLISNKEDLFSAAERIDDLELRSKFFKALVARKQRLINAVEKSDLNAWLDNAPISETLRKRVKDYPEFSKDGQNLFSMKATYVRWVLQSVYNITFREEQAFVHTLFGMKHSSL